MDSDVVPVVVIDDCRASTVKTATETEEWLVGLEASLLASGVWLSGVVLVLVLFVDDC